MVPTTLGLFTTMPGVPAVLTPMAADLANVTGWPVLTVVMTQVLGYSTVLFPYQASALVLAMECSQVRLTDVLRFLLLLAIWTLLVLTPLNYVWWRLLDYF
jgi:di/tricarboxylate transporter